MKPTTIKRIFSLAILGLALTSLAQSCLAADFYGIVDNFGRRPRNAFLDVAVDSRSGGGAPPEVTFNVYDSLGIQIAEFAVATQNGFASTTSYANLFNLTGGQPMLVRARTPLAPNFGAMLHVDSQGAPMTIGLLHKSRFDGTPFGAGQTFSVPLGSFRSASLLIANVSGSDIGVDIFKGTDGTPGTGYIQNPRLLNHSIWRVDLTQNEAFSNVIVISTSLMIVQVVVDDGRSIQSYAVPPSS